MPSTYRLPTATALAKLSPGDQCAILYWHAERLDEELNIFTPENIKSGYASFTNGMTMDKFKRSIRDRRRRLYKLGDEFGVDLVTGAPQEKAA